ncbi:hypothetical protein MAR_005359, partial [Mya arenaria]
MLEEEVRKLLVFIHAFTGCITTSRLYLIGKGATAAKYPTYRVYLQVQTWLGRGISPTYWGWMTNSDKLDHVKTSLTAVLERHMKMIRCCCRHSYISKPVTCMKHGLCCTEASGECHGLSYSNKGELFELDRTIFNNSKGEINE